MEQMPTAPQQENGPYLTYDFAAPAEIQTIHDIETRINDDPAIWKLAIKAYEFYGADAVTQQPHLAKVMGLSGVIETIDDVFKSDLDHEFGFDDATMQTIDSDQRLTQNKRLLNEQVRIGNDKGIRQIRLQNRIISMGIYIRRVKQTQHLAQTAVSTVAE